MVPKEVQTKVEADCGHGRRTALDLPWVLVGGPRPPRRSPLGAMASTRRRRPARPGGMPSHRTLVRSAARPQDRLRRRDRGPRSRRPPDRSRRPRPSAPRPADPTGRLAPLLPRPLAGAGLEHWALWSGVPLSPRDLGRGGPHHCRPRGHDHPDAHRFARGACGIRLAPISRGRWRRPGALVGTPSLRASGGARRPAGHVADGLG